MRALPALIISNPLEPSVNRDEVDCAVAMELVSSMFRIFGEVRADELRGCRWRFPSDVETSIFQT